MTKSVKDVKGLEHYANIAERILNNDTGYSKGKKIISDIFEKDIKETPSDTVIFRLTVIDNYYSTQMKMRLFGIKEIADKILEISKDDKDLSGRFTKFIRNIDNSEEKILSLFEDKYGYWKTGKEYGISPSIISKYAYFLTGYRFPIYDNLVKESYNDIKEKLDKGNELESLSKGQGYDELYFKNVSRLNKISGINDFDKLDMLLWLMGKINYGSFSLILDKNEYLELVKPIFPNKFEKVGSRDADKKIRDYIEKKLNKGSLNDIFNDETIEFIEFCFKKRSKNKKK